MFCQYCGAPLDVGARFCNRCGNAVPAVLIPRRSPDPAEVLNNHLQDIGILWVVFSIFHMLMGVWALVFAHYVMPEMLRMFSQQMNSNVTMPFPEFLKVFYMISFVFSMITGVVGLCAGWSLLRREQCGRTLALVAAFICLISIPFGTALAAYTLVVLLPPAAGLAYERLSRTVTPA
jgi:hypothetical protein